MNSIYRPTQLLVDLKAIEKNIANIKKMIGNGVQLMPVVKANGYGTHLNFMNEILSSFDYIAVALVDEAIAIRDIGYKHNILVLNPPVKEEYDAIIKYNLTVNGCNYDTLLKLNSIVDGQIKIHIELETGMGRTGVAIDDLDAFLKKIKLLNNIEIDGVFSHFSSSSKNLNYSHCQIVEFDKGLEIFKDNNINPKNIHLCSSGALLNFKDKLYNMVRIGIMLYGYYPNKQLKEKIKLYPSMILKTKINFLKEISIGTAVGYNKNFIAKRVTEVATIPFGFADGLIGLETGDPCVIVNERKAKIIGICMDNMMIDVTDIENVQLETDVYIWDNKNLTVEEIATWCNGICNYEIISSLSERIPRVIEKNII